MGRGKGRSHISRELNALSNDTYETNTGWEADAASGDLPELSDVDTPEALEDDAEDDVTPEAAAAAGEGAKPAKEAKAPARVAPPAGYITPVQFAKVLTEHLSGKSYQNKNGFVGRSADGETVDLKVNPIPPQYIYSMINQGNKPNAKNPVPTYVSAHDGTVYKTGEQPEGVPLARVNLMDQDEALAWWDAKDERVAASKAAKAAADAAKAAKAAAGPVAGTPAVEEPATPVEEAE